jgi:hypothetical protein
VDEPNSFGKSEFLKNIEPTNDQLLTTELGQHESASHKKSDVDECGSLAGQDIGEKFRLDQKLEEACLATGAIGAAIALIRGEKIVCHATAGSTAPDIGVCLDPRNGLSGSCIRTRQLQQCNDTETDPRVDPEASRTLGVRSIVVLPLVEGDKFFGIFEVLWSRPNAFGQRDLDTLQALTNRIVESRSQNWEATATVLPGESLPFANKVDEVVPQDTSLSSKLDSALPRREHISRRTDLRSLALGLLVIATAVLLGTLVGWRLGWQNATLALRASSPRHRISAPSKAGQIGRTVVPADGLQTSSAGMDECGLPAAASTQTLPPSGGLTVCQDGQVIFRQPASAPLPTRDLRNVLHSPPLPADSKRK